MNKKRKLTLDMIRNLSQHLKNGARVMGQDGVMSPPVIKLKVI